MVQVPVADFLVLVRKLPAKHFGFDSIRYTEVLSIGGAIHVEPLEDPFPVQKEALERLGLGEGTLRAIFTALQMAAEVALESYEKGEWVKPTVIRGGI